MESVAKSSGSEGRDVRRCMERTELSFYDGFQTVSGIPAYHLTIPQEADLPDEMPTYDEDLGEETTNVEESEKAVITCCAFSSDGSLLASGTNKGTACVWDVNRGRELVYVDHVHDEPISGISFKEGALHIVLTCDREGVCAQCDTRNSVNSISAINCAHLWKSTQSEFAECVSGQTSQFFDNGNLVVFPALVEQVRMGSGVYMVNTPKPCIKFSVVDTKAIPDLRCIAKLSLPVDESEVVTRMRLSPDRKGLLVGFTNKRVEEGYITLWPDFMDPDTFVRLEKGTLGQWAPDSSQVVTWTVPEEPFPQHNDGGCAFVWNVATLHQRLKEKDTFEADDSLADIKSTEPIVMRNPFGKNVLWCRFVLEHDGRSRLVMCVIQTTARLLFWDVAEKKLTHVIPTSRLSSQSFQDVQCCVLRRDLHERESVKGLDPLTTTGDMKWIGAVSGAENTAVVWDAAQGVELLRITLPAKLSEAIRDGADLLFQATPGKFALIGNKSVVVCCPPVASTKQQEWTAHSAREQQMVELTYEDPLSNTDASTKMAFSVDGEVLAVLHASSTLLHLWSLHDARQIQGSHGDHYVKVTDQRRGEHQLSLGEFLDFALAPDFSLSGEGSSLLVTYTTFREIVIWDCSTEPSMIVGVVHSKDEGVSRAIGLLSDTIIVCEYSGDLAWYTLNDATKQTDSAYSLLEHESRPLLRSGTIDELATGRSWITRKNVFASIKHLRRIRTDAAGSSRHSAVGYRFTEESFDRKTAHGSYACRFSADCKTAILMPNAAVAYLWDLENRTVLKSFENESALPFDQNNLSSALSLSQSTAMLARMATEEGILSNVDAAVKNAIQTDKLLDPGRNIVMSENDDVFLLSGDFGYLQTDTGAKTITNNLFGKSKSDEHSCLFVVNAQHPEHTKKILGTKLKPWKGMTISVDGRYLACASTAKTCAKLTVWSCHACDGLLPTFHALKIRDCVSDNARIMDSVPPLLERFGCNFINYVHRNGFSALFEALDAVNDEFLDVTLQFAAKHDLKVSLESSDGSMDNAIQIAIGKSSPEIVSKLMRYLMERVTYDSQMARILKACLRELSTKYPKIFAKTLHQPKLFTSIRTIRVPETLVEAKKFSETTSALLFATEDEIHEIWDKRYDEEWRTDDDPITTKVLAMVLPYPDACQIGKEGLLRHLLVNGVSDSCFSSFVVKAIVAHKWRSYAESLFRREFTLYVALLFSFTVYTFSLCYQDTYNSDTKEGDENNSWETEVSLAVCWVLAIPKLSSEFIQAGYFWAGDGLNGLKYWLQSGWNWMEMICYIIIVFVIPAGQFWFLQEGRGTTILSAIVAVESILLWCKMLYFARPFKTTGPLVITVSAIIRDILPFLILSFLVMFGFTMAFFVLYRHYRPVRLRSDGSGDLEEIHDSFGNFGRTAFTVVSYVFGDFDSGVLYESPEQGTAFVLFLLYMVIITIILLNMLIAIMSDSFNRIKSNEETQFIKARAVAIDDMESAFSKRKRADIQGRIGTYLHVVVPLYRREKIMNRRARQKRTKRKTSKGPSKDLKKILQKLRALMPREGPGDERGEPSEPRPRRDARTEAEEPAPSEEALESGSESDGSRSSSSTSDDEQNEADSESSISYDG